MTNSTGASFNPQRRAVITGVAAVSSQLVLPASGFANSKQPTLTGREKMDVERFVEDCVTANKETGAQAAVKEVLAKAVSTPSAVLAALGDPKRAGLNVLLSSPDLTIYGGDFFNTTRSQWNPETLEEEPSDGAVIRGMFQRENERLGLDT